MREADGIRDFFHVGMISYGGRVNSAFGGALAGMGMVPVSKIANNPLLSRNAHAQGGRRRRRSNRSAIQVSRLVRGQARWPNADVQGPARRRNI